MHEQILRNLQQKNYAPIYFLMGEEPYYIDQISDFIQNNVLDENQREFDLTVIYGKDTDIISVINAAKRFPMMSPYQVIIVKEAQLIKDLDKLQFYLNNVSKSTILVICYKYGTIDGRKKWVAEIKKTGVLFESKKLRDYEMIPWISKYAKSKNLLIDEKAMTMLNDFLGTNLIRIANELDKLCITMPAGSNKITPELVEKNIGISKDFNVFELQDALIRKDVVKANRIINYFSDNKKANPIQMVLAQLFGFFSNLMIFHYLPQKTAEAAASEFKIHPFIAKNYLQAAKSYNAWKTMNIVTYIRETDARSKGIDNVSANEGDLLKELIFKILH
ncbi:MAG: DNA polymerase III subunit delta [Paludibacter sp.]|nr:DNA polymerase III subunit delta [Paludibacter sp.]MDD4197873.1 DNA polymerase III subunit delta [Paludibacter sp.]MDD4428137.1 DNA polymerase III subunit delta [Paludibacter sp.]